MGSLCPKKNIANEHDSIGDPNSKENIKKRIQDLIKNFHKIFEENVVSI